MKTGDEKASDNIRDIVFVEKKNLSKGWFLQLTCTSDVSLFFFLLCTLSFLFFLYAILKSSFFLLVLTSHFHEYLSIRCLSSSSPKADRELGL